MRLTVLLVCVRVAAWSSRSRSRLSISVLVNRGPRVTQDVVGVIAATMDSTELPLERLGIQERGFSQSGGGKRRGRIESDVARGGQCPGPEPDRRAVSLADRTDAHDETDAAGVSTRLIRMKHHARIAQSRALNGELTGECRAEQEAAGWRQLQLRIQAIGELIGMP